MRDVHLPTQLPLIVFLTLFLCLAGDARAASVSDITTTLDWSAMSTTAGGNAVTWKTDQSFGAAHLQLDSSLGGAGYTVYESNTNYVAPWHTSAMGAILNASGNSVVDGADLAAHVAATADFTTTTWAEAGAIARRRGYFDPRADMGAVAISIPYEFLGSASTDVVGDSVSVLNFIARLRASLFYRDAAGAGVFTDLGRHVENGYVTWKLMDGADENYNGSGTLAVNFDPGSVLQSWMGSARVFVDFEAWAYTYNIAGQVTGPAVPEPSTLLLLGGGFALLIGLGARKRARASRR
jgi:PEP-CTERM motif